MHLVLPEAWCPLYDRDVAAVRMHIGDTLFEATWAEGRALTLEQAVALA